LQLLSKEYNFFLKDGIKKEYNFFLKDEIHVIFCVKSPCLISLDLKPKTGESKRLPASPFCSFSMSASLPM
jgi:hypothetical protein